MSFIRKAKKDHDSSEKPESLAIAYGVKKRKAGPINASEDEGDERPSSIADGIMRKKKDAKMMAEGGMVDAEGPSTLDSFEDLSEDAAMKELYDDSQLSPQPMDSNEHGDSIESDMLDMVSSIRAKLKAKRGN